MSYEFYKWMHISSLALLLLACGLLAATASGNTPPGLRKFGSALHGIGLLLMLVAGFGLLARLGLARGWPGWVWGKILILAAIAVFPWLVRKIPKPGVHVAILLALTFAAAYLAIFKP